MVRSAALPSAAVSEVKEQVASDVHAVVEDSHHILKA